MMRNHFFTAGRTVSAAIQRGRASLWLGVSILIAVPVHAQTTGTIPVWVDPSTQTLGDSSMVQCGDGTSVCVGPGNSPAIGPGSTLMGFTGSPQTNASAVYGEATASTGAVIGVVGVTQSSDAGATAVFGWAASTASTGGPTTGVWGRSSGAFGRGVVGESGFGGFGVYGLGDNYGYGVYGQGGRYGVYGLSTVDDAGAGVQGYSNTAGVGVRGASTNGIGVFGHTGNDASYAGFFQGRARVTSIPLLPSAAQVCFNSAGDLLQCGASSLRYKTDVRPFRDGLNIVQRLQPIGFRWKDGGTDDIGLAAEDVAQVAPALTITNRNGEPEGVKYERLNILLINAVNEQQTHIQRQQEQIDALKALVCGSHPEADVCR